MHVPFVREAHHLFHRQPEPDLQTSVSFIYVTASKTFAGPAVWITQLHPTQASHHKSDPTPTPAAEPNPKVTPASPSKPTSAAHGSDDGTSRDASSARESSTANSALPASITAAPSGGDATSLAALTTDPNAASTIAPLGAGASSSSDSAAASQESTSSGGMSAGGKAGLAIGILLAVGIIFGLAIFFYRRKKQMTENHQRLDDEKGAARNAGPMTAPRLSIRPVTQFLPSLGGPDNRSRGNTLDTSGAAPAGSTMTAGTAVAGAATGARGLRQPGASAAPAAPAPPTTPSMWEKMGQRDHANDPNNPFGNYAEAPASPSTSPPTPRPAALASTLPPVAPAATAGAGVSVIAAIAAQQSRESPKVSPVSSPVPSPVPKPLSIRSRRASNVSASPPSPALPSPAPTDVTTATGTEVPVALVAGARSGPTNVHRVQLNFKPSMDDELEIHAGQLVRLLHEYDDGWALCVRMDRAQQGVVPRTCLSKHAVKPCAPMPPNSPRGPPPRGPPPNAPYGAVPRPLTPTGRTSPPSPNAGPAPTGPPSGPNSPARSPNFANPPNAVPPAAPAGRQRSDSMLRSSGLDSMAPDQRRRSNSLGGANGPKKNGPPGSSPLGGGPTSPKSASAAGSMLPVPTRKPVPKSPTSPTSPTP